MRKVRRLARVRCSQRPLVLLAEQEDLPGAMIDAPEGRRVTLRYDDELGRDNLQAVCKLGVSLTPILAGGHDAELRRG